MPEVVDPLHLGEEAVAADVEAPAVALHRAADAAHDVVGLEHGGGDAGLGELLRGRETGRPGTDDDDAARPRRPGAVRGGGGAGLGLAHVSLSLSTADVAATLPKSVARGPIPSRAGPRRQSVDAGPVTDRCYASASCARGNDPRRRGGGRRGAGGRRGRGRERRLPLRAATARRRRGRRRRGGRPVRAALAPVARRGAQRQHRPPAGRRPARGACATTGTRRSTTCCSTTGWRWSASPTWPCGRCRASSPWPPCRWPGSPGRRLAGAAGGRWALVAVALSPFAVRYATETRMYSLVMLLVPGRLPVADRRPRAAHLAAARRPGADLGPAAAHPLLGLLPGRRGRPGARPRAWRRPADRAPPCGYGRRRRGRRAVPAVARRVPVPVGQHRHAVGIAVPAHRHRADHPRRHGRRHRHRGLALRRACWCCWRCWPCSRSARPARGRPRPAHHPTVRWELAVAIGLVLAIGAVVGIATYGHVPEPVRAPWCPLVLLAVAVGLVRSPGPRRWWSAACSWRCRCSASSGSTTTSAPSGRRGGRRRADRPSPATWSSTAPTSWGRPTRAEMPDGLVEMAYPTLGRARAGRLGRLRRAQRRRRPRATLAAGHPRPGRRPCRCSWSGCRTTTPSAPNART